MSKVSIIIPVYNASNKLNRCVDSVLKQSFSNIEVILVDDGSKDDSLSLCESIAQSDERVRVYHQENAGVSAARNLGIRKATGNWLMFVDSDDWVVPTAVAQMVELVEKDDSPMGVCSLCSDYLKNSITVVLDDEKLPISRIFAKYPQDSRLGMVLCTVCNKIFRREIISAHGIQFEQGICFGEDFIFNMRFFQHIQSVRTTSALLYHYDCTSENSGVKKIYSDYDSFILSMNQALRDFWNTVTIEDAVREVFNEIFIGDRWRYAVDVCLHSSKSLQEQEELIYRWINAMPIEMRMWKTLNDGEIGRLLRLWSNNTPSITTVRKEIIILQRKRRQREKVLMLKRLLRRVLFR